MPIQANRLLFALLLLPGLAAPATVFADTEDWVELPVGRFVVLYPAHLQEELGEAAGLYGQAADNAYNQFAPLYGPSPPLPINIRIYENQEQFAALNAVVPPLGPGAFHTHVGTREIALVAPFPFNFLNSSTVTHAMRHELNGLFLSSISGGHVPAGLEVGINQYVEGPGSEADDARSRLLSALADGRLLSWPELFEGTAVYTDREIAYPQSLSVAAFLADSYGYGTLVEFVRATADGNGYRSAFADIYGRPMDRLELEWQSYLPQYIETRWQYNALFNFDLAPFEAAIQAGAFSQVSRGLDEVIPWLELTNQIKAQAHAEGLRALAGQGIQAAELVQAERDALLNGEYERTMELALEAREAFAAMGPLGSAARLDEINLYESRAREVLGLRRQLAEAQRLASTGQQAEAEIRLAAILPRLQELGDQASAQAAAALLDDMRSRRSTESALARLAVGGLAALVVGHQALIFLRRRQKRRQPAIL